MANVKDFTGSVSVNDDITPTTRQKIEQVTPDKWHLMDINALYDQRIVLNNRMVMALQTGHGNIASQLQQGLNQLDGLMQRIATEKASEADQLI